MTETVTREEVEQYVGTEDGGGEAEETSPRLQQIDDPDDDDPFGSGGEAEEPGPSGPMPQDPPEAEATELAAAPEEPEVDWENFTWPPGPQLGGAEYVCPHPTKEGRWRWTKDPNATGAVRVPDEILAARAARRPRKGPRKESPSRAATATQTEVTPPAAPKAPKGRRKADKKPRKRGGPGNRVPKKAPAEAAVQASPAPAAVPARKQGSALAQIQDLQTALAELRQTERQLLAQIKALKPEAKKEIDSIG